VVARPSPNQNRNTFTSSVPSREADSRTHQQRDWFFYLSDHPLALGVLTSYQPHSNLLAAALVVQLTPCRDLSLRPRSTPKRTLVPQARVPSLDSVAVHGIAQVNARNHSRSSTLLNLQYRAAEFISPLFQPADHLHHTAQPQSLRTFLVQIWGCSTTAHLGCSVCLEF